MLNQIRIVGRIKEMSELKDNKCNIILGVSRSFENTYGEYEVDYIPCVLFQEIVPNTIEYCKIGDIVGIKGRIQRYGANDYTANGLPILEIVVEKITFLASRQEKENSRTCSECDKTMTNGYCIKNGMEYYCSDECLHKHYTQEEYLEMYDNGYSDTYWTEWEDVDDDDI